MLVASAMAEAIRVNMGFPAPVSPELLGWSQGIIDEITGFAKISNIAGTITGTCPGLADGAGADGRLSSMDGSRMADFVASNTARYGFTSGQLALFCTEIVDHLELKGRVIFAAGTITGTTPDGGALADGAGSNGLITSLDGPELADNVHNAIGYPGSTSARLAQFCTAVTDYIESDSISEYASGDVTGVCPAGGGALASGAGSNGSVS